MHSHEEPKAVWSLQLRTFSNLLTMQDPYFDIQWIIDLLKEQYPERLDLIADLNKSTFRRWVRQSYVQFGPVEKPYQSSEGWEYDESIALEHPTEGTIVLDISEDGRVGGAEFLKYVSK